MSDPGPLELKPASAKLRRDRLAEDMTAREATAVAICAALLGTPGANWTVYDAPDYAIAAADILWNRLEAER
jgi:hypothetical protein